MQHPVPYRAVHSHVRNIPLDAIAARQTRRAYSPGSIIRKGLIRFHVPAYLGYPMFAGHGRGHGYCRLKISKGCHC